MNKRLYVAYGSNLNIEQMKFRCPTAKLYGTGMVNGYELQFKGAPTNAFATIAPQKRAALPVAVWEIQTNDEKALDRYEGYPSHYFKQNIPVQLAGGEISAMVYIMNQQAQFGLPSPYYYQAVYKGYNDCKLDTAFLSEAIKNSAQNFYTGYVQNNQKQSPFTYSSGDGFDDDYEEKEEMNDNNPDETDYFYL